MKRGPNDLDIDRRYCNRYGCNSVNVQGLIGAVNAPSLCGRKFGISVRNKAAHGGLIPGISNGLKVTRVRASIRLTFLLVSLFRPAPDQDG